MARRQRNPVKARLLRAAREAVFEEGKKMLAERYGDLPIFQGVGISDAGNWAFQVKVQRVMGQTRRYFTISITEHT